MTTPCEELGYKVGDWFVVTERGCGMEVGDKIQLYHDDGSSCPLFLGNTRDHNYHLCRRKDGAYKSLHSVRKTVKEKEEMQFDMKKNNWYITFSNEEEFNLIQDWLKSKGFSPKYSDEYDSDADCFTKTRFSDLEDEYIRDSKSCAKAEGAEEIKINFKTVIDSVTFPEVKSERDLKIEELEQSIKEAQERLNELKALK